MYSWRVPTYAWGTLRIVAKVPAADGDILLGPLYYNFSPLYHAAKYIYILPLLLAFALKENRRFAAFWILVPLLLAWSVRSFLGNMIPDASGRSLLSAHIAGLAAVGLLAHRIGNRRRVATVAIAAVIMLGFVALMLIDIEPSGYLVWRRLSRIGYQDMSFTPFRLLMGLLGAVGVLVALGGFVFAGLRCREEMGLRRFLGGLGFGMLLMAALAGGSVAVWTLGAELGSRLDAAAMAVIPVVPGVIAFGGVLCSRERSVLRLVLKIAAVLSLAAVLTLVIRIALHLYAEMVLSVPILAVLYWLMAMPFICLSAVSVFWRERFVLLTGLSGDWGVPVSEVAPDELTYDEDWEPAADDDDECPVRREVRIRPRDSGRSDNG